MKREDLIRSKEYWTIQIQNDLYGIIEDFMQRNKLNRRQLAEKFHVTKGYITQILNGDFDHKLSKFIELSLASGKAPIVSFVDLDQYVKDDIENNFDISKQKRPIYFINIGIISDEQENLNENISNITVSYPNN